MRLITICIVVIAATHVACKKKSEHNRHQDERDLNQGEILGNIVLNLKRDANFVLFEKLQSGSLYPVRSFGDKASIKRIENYTTGLDFGFFFEDGAEAILVVDYKSTSADDPHLVSNVDFIPVYNGRVDIAEKSATSNISVEAIFGD